MRRASRNTVFCWLLTAALLMATSQYLAHFHIPQAYSAPAALISGEVPEPSGHASQEHCSLCLQFDRLPATPAASVLPQAYFHLVATLEAERLERLALDAPQLWPPSRGPPRFA